VELIFANNFCLGFWGYVRETATECSIIDVDPYMIPHFEANMFQPNWEVMDMENDCITHFYQFKIYLEYNGRFIDQH